MALLKIFPAFFLFWVVPLHAQTLAPDTFAKTTTIHQTNNLESKRVTSHPMVTTF